MDVSINFKKIGESEVVFGNGPEDIDLTTQEEVLAVVIDDEGNIIDAAVGYVVDAEALYNKIKSGQELHLLLQDIASFYEEDNAKYQCICEGGLATLFNVTHYTTIKKFN